MKLLLADDHTLFRDALVLYIQRAEPRSQISLAQSFFEAFEIMAQKSDQDLVLLDLRMPGMNGLEGFVRMRDQYPNVKVALMSGVAEPEDVRAAMALGAVGYFPKTLSGKNLIKAIKIVLQGEIFFPMSETSELIMPSYYDDYKPFDSGSIQPMYGQTAQKPAVVFTPREKQVIAYLAKGCTNKEIAEALGLQVVTVKLHVRSICQKLEAKNRTQAALLVRDLLTEKKF